MGCAKLAYRATYASLQGYLLFLLYLRVHLLCLGLLHHLLHDLDVIAYVLLYVLHVEEVQGQALHLCLQGGHCGDGGCSAVPLQGLVPSGQHSALGPPSWGHWRLLGPWLPGSGYVDQAS